MRYWVNSFSCRSRRSTHGRFSRPNAHQSVLQKRRRGNRGYRTGIQSHCQPFPGTGDGISNVRRHRTAAFRMPPAAAHGRMARQVEQAQIVWSLQDSLANAKSSFIESFCSGVWSCGGCAVPRWFSKSLHNFSKSRRNLRSASNVVVRPPAVRRSAARLASRRAHVAPRPK